MTKFQNKSFSVAMPGNKGNWPWPDEQRTEVGTCYCEHFQKFGWCQRVAMDRVGTYINIQSEEADAIREHGGNA